MQLNVIATILKIRSENAFQRLFSSKSHYDIVVAGGGMIGTTLACTLGRNEKLACMKILLLEGSKKKPWCWSEKYSNRVSSLNPGTFALLNEIGAWKYIARFAPVKKLQVWDSLSEAIITFNNDDLNSPVSYIVENDVLLNAVGKELKTIENIEVLYEAKIKNYDLPSFEGNTVKIQLEDSTVFTCDLLLGCDGANSQVRKSMGIQYLSWNYNHMGLVATLKMKESSENVVAWQRFLPTGPIAILPLAKDLSSLVWSTTPEKAKQLLSLSEEMFVQALNDALWKECKKSVLVEETTKTFDNFLRFLNCSSSSVRQLPPTIVGCQEKSRAIFPYGFGHATNYIGKGVVLVGDAAHRVHPLAGQGVNLGFGDIICLNNILGELIYAGSKLDNMNYLKQYETDRQRHNVPTMLAIEGLYRIYNTEFMPFVLLRSLGLQAVHAFSPLKRTIISQAAV